MNGIDGLNYLVTYTMDRWVALLISRALAGLLGTIGLGLPIQNFDLPGHGLSKIPHLQAEFGIINNPNYLFKIAINAQKIVWEHRPIEALTLKKITSITPPRSR
jgi:hypothetical protein